MLIWEWEMSPKAAWSHLGVEEPAWMKLAPAGVLVTSKEQTPQTRHVWAGRTIWSSWSSRCQLRNMGTPWLLEWLITTSRTTALGRTSETWCYSGSFRALSLSTNKPPTFPTERCKGKTECISKEKERESHLQQPVPGISAVKENELLKANQNF